MSSVLRFLRLLNGQPQTEETDTYPLTVQAEVLNQGAGRLIPSGDWENLQACFQLLVVADSSWLFSTSRYSFSLH